MDEKNYPQHMSLEERRARLRELMKRDDATVEEYHAIIGGATEEERVSLAKTLKPAQVVDVKNYTPLAAYVAGALIRKPDGFTGAERPTQNATAAFHQLLWNNRKGGQHQDIGKYFVLGASKRSEDWILAFVESIAESWAYGEESWPVSHQLLRERNIICESPQYLGQFIRNIPPVREDSTYNRAAALNFFKDDPLLLEQEFWALFRVEGTMRDHYWTLLGPTGSMLTLMRHMQDFYEEFRERVLDESLQSLTRDFSAANSRVFHQIYRGMEPTEAENLERAHALMALLGSAPSTTVGLAQEILTPLVVLLSGEQAAQLVEASQPVLFRTEKKVLRAHLKLLKLLVTHHPELAGKVSLTVGEAVETMPVDVQDTARTLILAPHRNNSEEVKHNPGRSISIPDITPHDGEPGEYFATCKPLTSDTEFLEILIEHLEGNTDGFDYPPLLSYLQKNHTIELDKAQRQYVYTKYKTLLANSALRCLTYLVLKPYQQEDGLDLQRTYFRGYYTSSFYQRTVTGELVRTVRTAHNYRGPKALLAEQIASLDLDEENRTPLVVVPLPARKDISWVRSEQRVCWEEKDATPKTPETPFEQAALNTHGTVEEYLERSGDGESWNIWNDEVVRWYAWLTQNNPDVLAVQFLPLAFGAVYQSQQIGLPSLLQALGHSHQVLRAPSYTVIGQAMGAQRREYRTIAAEAIALLAERGMLDTAAFSAELSWLLTQKHLMTNRAVETLTDAASISPLTGWRVLQILAEILPVAGEVNRGGSLVQLAGQLAEEYGVTIEIPEVLRPKMKGSTVLAKSLRVLDTLQPHPTELAEQARNQAREIVTKNGAGHAEKL